MIILNENYQISEIVAEVGRAVLCLAAIGAWGFLLLLLCLEAG